MPCWQLLLSQNVPKSEFFHSQTRVNHRSSGPWPDLCCLPAAWPVNTWTSMAPAGSARQPRKTSYTPDLRSMKRGEPSVMPTAVGASELVIEGRPYGLPKRAGQEHRVSKLAGSPRARPRTSKSPSSDERW
jgi:hypothetical protein